MQLKELLEAVEDRYSHSLESNLPQEVPVNRVQMSRSVSPDEKGSTVRMVLMMEAARVA